MVFEEVQNVVCQTSRISVSRATTSPERRIRACSRSNSLRERRRRASPFHACRRSGSSITSWTLYTQRNLGGRDVADGENGERMGFRSGPADPAAPAAVD